MLSIAGGILLAILVLLFLGPLLRLAGLVIIAACAAVAVVVFAMMSRPSDNADLHQTTADDGTAAIVLFCVTALPAVAWVVIDWIRINRRRT
jgi:hypothetical protein